MSVQTKKFLVLAILFMLPISVYLFFASGKNNFVKLPTLTHGVHELSSFKELEGKPIKLDNRITILMFFGADIDAKKASAFNLAHKIYKKNYQFKEFQFVTLITAQEKEKALALKDKLAEIENPENWRFAVGSPEDITRVYESLKMPTATLDASFGTNSVFIIDKERSLRGRDDDEDYGVLHGYNASDYAEVNNKMSDDIKVVLAEYRLALKKYKADRKDEFRDNNLK